MFKLFGRPCRDAEKYFLMFLSVKKAKMHNPYALSMILYLILLSTSWNCSNHILIRYSKIQAKTPLIEGHGVCVTTKKRKKWSSEAIFILKVILILLQ